jgi:predicted dehydrogenase
MAPIRVGLIGLSTAATPQRPGAWAVLAHLPSILNSPDYQLVALANSTVESAKKSIEFHNLPPETRAYGSAVDLAQDDEVDLVVVSVNVQKRPNLVKPAVLAGKDVFVEWPLGANSQEAREFASLAKAHGSKTIVGLQARADPLVLKTREVLASGKIGRVTSSSVFGCLSPLSTDVWIPGAEYYLDMESGGNAFTIFFGHCKSCRHLSLSFSFSFSLFLKFLVHFHLANSSSPGYFCLRFGRFYKYPVHPQNTIPNYQHRQ